MLFIKIIASIALLMGFGVGILRANPKSHSPIRPAMAEYGAGFIMCALSSLGFYYLWFA